MNSPVINTLLEHRSIRRYKPQSVPDDHVRLAIEAGQAASTSSAVQSYSILRIQDEETLKALVPLTGKQDKVAASGAFFAICGDTRRHRLVCERAGKEYHARLEGFLLAVIDATLFAQNLVVAFESMGYGICYIGGLRGQLAEVDHLLNIPEGVYPLYGLCVGIPDEQPVARPRLPIEAILFDDHYPDDETMLKHIDSYDETYLSYLAERQAPVDRRVPWSRIMADKFSEPRRADTSAYYQSKGADLS